MSQERRFPARMASGLLIGLVKAYRLVISPLLPPRCRHLPTCSEYAIEAIERHGPFRGALLALKRIARCHPWGTSGLDPVPLQAVEKRREEGRSQGARETRTGIYTDK